MASANCRGTAASSASPTCALPCLGNRHNAAGNQRPQHGGSCFIAGHGHLHEKHSQICPGLARACFAMGRRYCPCWRPDRRSRLLHPGRAKLLYFSMEQARQLFRKFPYLLFASHPSHSPSPHTRGQRACGPACSKASFQLFIQGEGRERRALHFHGRANSSTNTRFNGDALFIHNFFHIVIENIKPPRDVVSPAHSPAGPLHRPLQEKDPLSLFPQAPSNFCGGPNLPRSTPGSP